jgi:hypothetical protein
LTEYGVLAFIATCPRAQHSDWAISHMCNHAHRQLHVAEESQLHVPLAQLNDVQSQVAGCGAPQEPSPGADVAAASQSRCRCGSGEPSPVADVAAASQSRCRCGSGEPSPGADVATVQTLYSANARCTSRMIKCGGFFDATHRLSAFVGACVAELVPPSAGTSEAEGFAASVARTTHFSTLGRLPASQVFFFGIHVAGLQCTSGMQHITSQTTRGVCTSSTHVAESVPCMQHATREAASFYSARASA